jgi:hypothetical protein
MALEWCSAAKGAAPHGLQAATPAAGSPFRSERSKEVLWLEQLDFGGASGETNRRRGLFRATRSVKWRI